jgi:hypothetical protein
MFNYDNQIFNFRKSLSKIVNKKYSIAISGIEFEGLNILF